MRNVLLVGIGLLAGCGTPPAGPRYASDGTELMAGFDPPGPPASGLQVVSPIIRDLKPGTNVELCYYSRVVLDKPVTIKSGQGWQTPGGHHAVIYWTQKKRDETVHECSEDDMLTAHVLSGGGGETGNGVENSLPAGTAFKVPVGAQLMVQIHVINASQQPIDAQAVVNLNYGEPGLQPVSSFYVTGTDLSIPAGKDLTYETGCTIPTELKVVRILAHLHEWGTRGRVSHTDAQGKATVLYDKPWEPEYSSNPPYLDFSKDSPLVIKAGDKVSAICDWHNPQDKPMGFPTEMCAAFGYVLGDMPEMGCSDGAWNNR